MAEVSLRLLAQSAVDRACGMTGVELIEWYVEHVGYDPVQDDPSLARSPSVLTQCVASMMFLHSCPDGLETPGAEQAERELVAALLATALKDISKINAKKH